MAAKKKSKKAAEKKDALKDKLVAVHTSVATHRERPEEENSDTSYMKGPILLRGKMVPAHTTSGNLLAPEHDTNWLHEDPWRVLRIQAEFVEGFGALAELGPAISIFGSARLGEGHPDGIDYWTRFVAALANAGYDGVLSIEHEDEARPRLDGVIDSIRILQAAIAAQTTPA